MDFSAAVKVGREKHPRNKDKTISYGTAGFRTKGEDLDHVIYRMGLLAVLRAKCKKGTIGVMITASHNPEEDNGVKLVDPMGEMLEMAWEKFATQLANVRDEEISAVLQQIVQECSIDVSVPATVVYAKDTRPSSVSLAKSLDDGICALGGDAKDYGLLSTPQLHYMVRCINTDQAYGQPCEEGYYNKIKHAFKTLRGQEPSQGSYKPVVTVDGANGVGALVAAKLSSYLGDSLKLNILNDGSSGKLNHMCGADFVKVQQKAPEGVTMVTGGRYLSYDGDADRIVYYFLDENDKFRLLDGDKIATLVASYLKELVSETGVQLDMGLVQTAYANGSSTAYITNTLQVPVACVPTGVKHLHHRAMQFDIGVYFEANGHGTVLFSEEGLKKITAAKDDSSASDSQRQAAGRLLLVVDLINQTVGDALSDMLLVETVLHSRGWSANNWNAAYTDLPNRQLKIKVADRTVVQTTDAERRTTSPPGLQEAIDKLVSNCKNGRSFVRPSGTEDVVRVYAEADTQENADKLAHDVSVAVYNLAGGVGDPPKPL